MIEKNFKSYWVIGHISNNGTFHPLLSVEPCESCFKNDEMNCRKSVYQYFIFDDRESAERIMKKNNFKDTNGVVKECGLYEISDLTKGI